MPSQLAERLTRREREIMNAVFALNNRASAEEIRVRLSNPPSDSSVRVMLARLEKKGYLKHQQHGLRYVYLPTVSREKARQSALKQMLRTFFDDSTGDAVATLLGISKAKLSKADLDRLSKLIDEARKEGR